MVTHDISLALRCSERLMIMSQGAISWSGKGDDDAVVSELEKVYQCRFVRVEHQDLQSSILVAR
jgi:ABC-type cobalamin/Fe3+-siderophores transport system ATPase subunit